MPNVLVHAGPSKPRQLLAWHIFNLYCEAQARKARIHENNPSTPNVDDAAFSFWPNRPCDYFQDRARFWLWCFSPVLPSSLGMSGPNVCQPNWGMVLWDCSSAIGRALSPPLPLHEGRWYQQRDLSLPELTESPTRLELCRRGKRPHTLNLTP